MSWSYIPSSVIMQVSLRTSTVSKCYALPHCDLSRQDFGGNGVTASFVRSNDGPGVVEISGLVTASFVRSNDGPGVVEISGLGVVIFCLVEAHPGMPEMATRGDRHAAFHAFYAFSRHVDGHLGRGEVHGAFKRLDGPRRQRKQWCDRCRQNPFAFHHDLLDFNTLPGRNLIQVAAKDRA
jgi:hypothetical protein